MTKSFYEFTVGSHNEQAHEHATLLWALARRGKDAGNPTDASDRIARVGEMCEEHYRQIGKNPDKNVLDRLASLILFDELTDTHPDKMTREEYPIMSEWQEDVRDEKYIKVEELTYNDRQYTGRRKSSFVGENGEVGVSNSRLPNVKEAPMESVPDRLDVKDLLDNAGLTDRQRQAIVLVFFKDMTQEDAGRVMGINKSNINAYISASLRKLRDYITNI